MGVRGTMRYISIRFTFAFSRSSSLRGLSPHGLAGRGNHSGNRVTHAGRGNVQSVPRKFPSL